MIDTWSLKTSIYDLATSGQLSAGYTSTDAVDEILKNVPSLSAKRKKLLTKDYQYGEKHAIPSSWRWVRLGEISSYGDTPEKTDADKCADDVWLLDLEDIEAGGKLLHKTRVSEKRSKGEKTTFTEGQILYSKLRPYLKKVLIADEDGISTPELISFDVFGGIDARYIVFCLLNTFTNKAIDARSYGIKMPRVDAGFMVNLPIPLPPISEQKYIADKVESVLSEIDSIAEAQTRYTSDVAALKSKIIDAGIRGKLTEQLPEDGTAQELFEQIQAEKTCLVREGKIKKQKSLPPIKPEEVPFDVPENWVWVRLEELAFITKLAGFEYTKNVAPNLAEHGIPLFKGKNIQDGRLILKFESYIPENISDSLPRSQLIKKCLLIPYVGTIGNVAIFDGSFKAHLGSNVGKVELFNEDTTYISEEYIWYYLRSSEGYRQLTKKKKATAQESISMEALRNVFVSLPPLAEQQRIAERIEEILSAFSES